MNLGIDPTRTQPLATRPNPTQPNPMVAACYKLHSRGPAQGKGKEQDTRTMPEFLARAAELSLALGRASLDTYEHLQQLSFGMSMQQQQQQQHFYGNLNRSSLRFLRIIFEPSHPSSSLAAVSSAQKTSILSPSQECNIYICSKLVIRWDFSYRNFTESTHKLFHR